ncbi:hypothetical protein WAQ86_004740 [Salmonella enterica]
MPDAKHQEQRAIEIEDVQEMTIKPRRSAAFYWWTKIILRQGFRYLILNPFIFVLVITVSAMLISQTSSRDLATSAIESIADYVSYGPAEKGYLNVSYCVNPPERQPAPGAAPEMPDLAVACKEHGVKAVPIAELADNAVENFKIAYLFIVFLSSSFYWLISFFRRSTGRGRAHSKNWRYGVGASLLHKYKKGAQ